MQISESITDLIGKTPMVWLKNPAHDLPGKIALKLEFFNPYSSVKDRVGIAMLEAAEQSGSIDKEKIIVEPTSGNTGVSLAFACAAKGYKLILVMPETIWEERRRLLRVFGAELIFTPAAEGMDGAIKCAEELAKSNRKYFVLHQFQNPVNPEVHRTTTGQEIWEDTDGGVDFVVAGIGTGGTITGIAEAIKPKKESFKAVGVEPAESPILCGGRPGPHKFHGIGAGFFPPLLRVDLLDEIIKVDFHQALKTTHALARQEGVFAGIASGAVAWAAMELAKRKENKDKLIVAIVADSGERYLSMDYFK